MPKRLVARAPRKAALMPYEDRPLRPDEVRTRVDYASPKHGSELADFRGENPHRHERFDQQWQMFLPKEETTRDPYARPWPLGNQWIGTITEVGSEVVGFRLGERVTGYGGIAETHVARYHGVLKLPEGMSWKSAVCYDPAQYALAGIRDSHLRLGDRVAVIGLGALGQIAAQMARLAGAGYVAVVDPIAKRRDVALAAGADAAFDPSHQDVGLEIKKATDKAGVDVVIETSGSERALQAALRGLAYGGTIAYVGWARPFPGGLDLGREAHFNNATLVFSRACSAPMRDHPRWTFDRIGQSSWQMLSRGQIRCEEIVDPVVPFDQAAAAFEEYVDQHPERSIKLGISLV